MSTEKLEEKASKLESVKAEVKEELNDYVFNLLANTSKVMKIKGEGLAAFVLCCAYLLKMTGNELTGYTHAKMANGFLRITSIKLNDIIITKKSKKDVSKIS